MLVLSRHTSGCPGPLLISGFCHGNCSDGCTGRSDSYREDSPGSLAFVLPVEVDRGAVDITVHVDPALAAANFCGYYSGLFRGRFRSFFRGNYGCPFRCRLGSLFLCWFGYCREQRGLRSLPGGVDDHRPGFEREIGTCRQGGQGDKTECQHGHEYDQVLCHTIASCSIDWQSLIYKK